MLVPAIVGAFVGYLVGSNKERKCDLPGMTGTSGASKDFIPAGIPAGAPGVPTGNCDQIMNTAVASLPPEQKAAILTVWNSGNAVQLTQLADSMAPAVMANPALAPVITCLRQKANGVKGW